MKNQNKILAHSIKLVMMVVCWITEIKRVKSKNVMLPKRMFQIFNKRRDLNVGSVVTSPKRSYDRYVPDFGAVKEVSGQVDTKQGRLT